jgi:hypothetical protein
MRPNPDLDPIRIPSLGHAPAGALPAMRERVLAAAEAAGRAPGELTCALNVQVRIGDGAGCCAALILRMPVTLILGMRGLWKTPPNGFRRGWVVLGVSRVVLRVSR